jgi:hypothetical protein
MGAVRIDRTALEVSCRFPDGARHNVPKNIRPGAAKVMLNRLRRMYDRPWNDPLAGAEKRPGAPVIDLGRVVASKHAMERFDQMRRSGDLEYREVLVALKAPSKVLWHPGHDSWLWVGDRIAVAASITPNGQAVIRTILWTTAELWADNPRPEKAQA